MGMIKAPPGTLSFPLPNPASYIPHGYEDVVSRLVAAAMKLMYSKQLRPALMRSIQSKEPAPKRLALSVVGLFLMLDGKTRGGIPLPAIFPACLAILGEACKIAVSAHQQVSQSDYKQAALIMATLIAQKMGGSPQQIMGGYQRALAGQQPAQPGAV